MLFNVYHIIVYLLYGFRSIDLIAWLSIFSFCIVLLNIS